MYPIFWREVMMKRETYHFLHHEVRCRQSQLQARSKRDRSQWTVWCNSHIIRFRHGRYALRLGDATGVRNVGLQDVDQALLEERLHVPAVVQSLAERNRYGCHPGQLLQGFGMLDQDRFLNEHRPVWFKSLRELLRHRPVQTAMKVQTRVETCGFDGFETLDARVNR